MNAQPGWYTDPSNPNAQRWWDGTKWTEHTHQPVQPAPQPAQTPPVAPPTLVAPSAPQPSAPFPQAGGVPPVQPGPAGPWQASAVQSAGTPAPRRRSVLPWAIIGVVAVVVAGGVFVALRSSNEEPTLSLAEACDSLDDVADRAAEDMANIEGYDTTEVEPSLEELKQLFADVYEAFEDVTPAYLVVLDAAAVENDEIADQAADYSRDLTEAQKQTEELLDEIEQAGSVEEFWSLVGDAPQLNEEEDYPELIEFIDQDRSCRSARASLNEV